MFKLEINNRTKFQVPRQKLLAILRKARRALKINRKQTISLAFVSPKRIQSLNKVYRKKNHATDVLSFAGDKECPGEIIVCPNQAKQQAEFGFQKEIVKLVLHGYLHLLGYDHETEKDALKMEKLEKKITS